MEALQYLTLDVFAAISARLDAGLPRDQVLAQAGIDDETWSREQAFWLATLAQQTQRKRLALHNQYVELFLAHRDAALHELRQAKRRISGPMPRPPAQPVASSVAFLGSRPAPWQTAAGGAAPVGPTPGVAATPRLTIEQLATLSAELAVAAHDTVQVLQRFRLTPDAYRVEQHLWNQRFGADPALRDRYVKLFEYYRALISTDED